MIRVQANYFFGWDMILKIKNVVDWRYIRQNKQVQVEKYFIHENSTRIDYDYRVGDRLILSTKTAYKFETSYKGPYKIVQAWKNGTVTLWTGVVTTRTNICHIKPYHREDAEWRSHFSFQLTMKQIHIYKHIYILYIRQKEFLLLGN